MLEYFLSKKSVLNDAMIKKLKKEFRLSDFFIKEIKKWNNPLSSFGGVIITLTSQQKPCYPYRGDEMDFKKKFPNGMILEDIQ